MEIFKDIPGYEGLYNISNEGRIFNIQKQKYVNYSLCGTTVKYYQVGLMKNKQQKLFYVHRLVLIAFSGYDSNKQRKEVDHIDFNPLNNHLDNLRWVTSKENSQHSKEHLKQSKQGEKHPLSKFTDAEALHIKQLRKQGLKHKAIATMYNTTTQNIMNVCTRYYSHLNYLVD